MTARASSTELWNSIVAVYKEAQESGAATKTESDVHLVQDPSLGFDFIIRVAMSLKSKPKGPARWEHFTAGINSTVVYDIISWL